MSRPASLAIGAVVVGCLTVVGSSGPPAWSRAGGAAVLSGGHGIRRSRPDSCTLAMGRVTPITTDDGSTVSLDAESVVYNNGALAIVGSHTHLWPRGARRGTAPVRDGSALGVVLKRNGRATVIPNPLVGRRAIYPRVTADGSLTWQMLFMTSGPTALNAAGPAFQGRASPLLT